MSTIKAAVVIPTHYEELDELQKISLEQVQKVLGNYPIIFAVPLGKNFSYIPKNCRVIQMPHLGHGVSHYDILMKSPMFYETFFDYDYILIYHLDAFVFSDELEYFCSLDYDYIGAPWPFVYGRVLVKADNKSVWLRVGNGGFCLRNVKSHYKFVTEHRDLVEKYHEMPDDAFIAYCGNMNNDFHVAPVSIAYQFAAEFNPARVVKKNGGKLPFGCHDWIRRGADFYITTFKKFGYDLTPYKDRLLDESSKDLQMWLTRLATFRMLRSLSSGGKISKYLSKKNYYFIRVVSDMFSNFIADSIKNDKNISYKKIFMYNTVDIEKLVHDSDKSNKNCLLIAGGGDGICIMIKYSPNLTTRKIFFLFSTNT